MSTENSDFKAPNGTRELCLTWPSALRWVSSMAPRAPLSSFATCSFHWKDARCTAPQGLLPSAYSLGLANGEPRRKMGRKERHWHIHFPVPSPWSHCRLLCLSTEGHSSFQVLLSLCLSLVLASGNQTLPSSLQAWAECSTVTNSGHCSNLWVSLHTALLLNSPLPNLPSNYPIWGAFCFLSRTDLNHKFLFQGWVLPWFNLQN